LVILSGVFAVFQAPGYPHSRYADQYARLDDRFRLKRLSYEEWLKRED